MVRLYTFGKKQLYLAMYRFMLLKAFATTTKTYENFALHFTKHEMVSTLVICLLRYCNILPLRKW